MDKIENKIDDIIKEQKPIENSTQLFMSEKNRITKKVHKNTFLAIILKSNKSISLVNVPFDEHEFRVDGNTYFTIPEGMYLGKKRFLLTVYLEGISTPFSHRNVKKKAIERTIKLEDGTTETIKLNIIDGLKYDSEIIDILLNRGLAEKLTQIPRDKAMFIAFALIIINMLLTIIAIGVEFR